LPQITVFGASGPVGRFLLPRLSHRGDRVVGISRQVQPSSASVSWIKADLYGDRVDVPDSETIISVGPLDAFASWFAATSVNCKRVIALSSMSAASKQDSPDPAERALAAQLASAEQRLIAASKNSAWTIFRPTLIYGAGVDRSLAPIARFAQRWHVLPIPSGRCGLRQPVHAEDLAIACVAALDRAQSFGNIYPLGGGERLPFDALLRRLRDSLSQTIVKLPVPLAMLQMLAPFAPHLGVARVGIGTLRRLKEDLVADNSRAAADFGYAPRNFIAADVLGQ
jgi:nucleoside-diphosphate-sugar epimerase